MVARQNALYHRSIAAKSLLKEMNIAETTLDSFGLNIIVFCMLLMCNYSQFRSVKMIYRVRKSCIKKSNCAIRILKIYLPNLLIVLSVTKLDSRIKNNAFS